MFYDKARQSNYWPNINIRFAFINADIKWWVQ